MAQRYADLPKRIMGLRCSQHRAIKMIQVLDHYNKQCVRAAKKAQMLKLMVLLEEEITDAEKKVIGDWMLSESRDFKEALNANSSRSNEDSDFDVPLALLKRHSTAQRVVPPPDLECSVCMDSFPRHAFLQHTITDSCNHEVTVCNLCAKRSVQVQMADQPYQQIACPECPELLTLDIIRIYSTPEDFDRYSMKGFKESLEKMEGYAKCLGPNCDSGQIHGSGHDQPIMTCPECHFKTCYTHMVPWHTDKTCAEYDEEQRECARREQEEASKRLVAETSKACPNPSCGCSIEKDGGCDHMTCRRCMHDFCWLCMASYTQIRRVGNTAHEETCKYHSAKLPAYVQG